MEEPGRIVLLNGVGSAGKSSIARALQDLARRPLLHVQMDSFLEMLPARLFGTPEGLVFEEGRQDGQPSVAIRSGPAVARTLAGMRRAVAAMARAGNDLVVDDVLLDRDAADYRQALDGLTVHWVAVVAPLETLESRERARGDRLPGLARWQYPRVHGGIDYDLTVDSEAADAAGCARMIRDRFDL